jgi:hypothetical protein
VLSCADIELKSVPRASDDRSVECPFPERPAQMGANAIEGMKFAVDIEYRHNIIPHDNLSGLADWHVFLFQHAYPMGQDYSPSLVVLGCLGHGGFFGGARVFPATVYPPILLGYLANG